MKKTALSLKATATTLALLMGTSNAATAQEKFEANVGADIVSNYIWRGQDCGGVSIQPTLSVAKSGLSLTAWGSVGFSKSDTKEIDLTLGYEKNGFNVAVTDYWFHNPDAEAENPEMGTVKYFEYGAHSTAHVFEATVGYDFGPLALSWNTYFAGDDYTKKNGDRAYSSYFEATAPFRLGGLDFAAEVGITPWEGAYSTGFNVVNIGLGASKDIKITDSFTVPAYAKVVVNPNSEKAYFIFGINF